MKDGITFTAGCDLAREEEFTEEDREYEENLANFANLQVVGEDLRDEDTYVEGQPFEIIASKMENLLPNGKIKKRIVRKGYGDKPVDGVLVRVHYNAYIEFNAEPFDSTYARKRYHQFQINNGQVLPCLDIAVQSMSLNEKSQFLVAPDYAYGALGCLHRVPPNSEVLFEIELMEIVDIAATMGFDSLSSEEKKKFKNLHDFCLAMCAKGKDLYHKNIKAAIKEYNTAVGHLENAVLENYDEESKQQDLLLKLYTNLLVCYTKEEEPKKGCVNFNKIKDLLKGTNKEISPKVYYNNAKCLRMLGEYDLARKRLNIARKMEPKNPDILNEFIILDQELNEYKKKQVELGKALVNSTK